ncbi:MAG: serpin family protein [Candidatus Eisenbacteria bacterium]|nr:serpin family protein [Candidatus Eisenbacteria bacterium]
MRKLHALLIALLFLSVIACGGKDNPVDRTDPFELRKIPAELAADVETVVEANNRFALDLYGALKNREGNLFFSPFSISTALAMTCAGARNETADEMESALHFDVVQDNLHASYGALVESIDRGSTTGGYRLSTANRLWGQAGYHFLDEFLATCANDYHAPMDTLDFVADPESARVTINDWVEEKTEGKIEDLLQPGTIHDLIRLVLTNAIYFKGDWLYQFDETETVSRPFHLSGGGETFAPFMSQREGFGYLQGDGFAALEMLYVGEDLSMLVFLPDERDGLGEIEAQLTHENLESWIASLDTRTVDVFLPSFTFTTTFALVPELAELGIEDAFIPGAADFSGIDGTRELFIGDVIHKAFVQVNEEGTEAAAATAVTVDASSIPDYPVFRADHPFLFLILDRVTGSILFLGRVDDPTA